MIPDDLLEDDSETHKEAETAAETLTNSKNEKVLDDVFGNI